MSSNPNEFLSHLKESGLLAADQLDELRHRFAADSVDECISGLVERGWLTDFQVKQLHAGNSKGLVLGQYHILDEVGRGGYGCVYKARHKLMDRVVALKVIAPDLVADARARSWFRREVFAATQLNHPNICTAYDADDVDNILFFAMEYIDGSNLEFLVRKRGPLPIGMACELTNQAAKALQYAHEKGMVHRDIKPANMLIPRDVISQNPSDFTANSGGVIVKLVDFGLARLQKASPHNTLMLQSDKGFVGTPAFVSPEQARNVHDVDIRSDLYSLGCTLYFALTGRAPFAGESVFELLAHHLESEPEPIEHRRREIPPALASIVRRLMAKKPDKRFQTPAELIAEMGFFFSTDRSNMSRPAPSFPVAPEIAAQTPPPTPLLQASSFVGPLTENLSTDVRDYDTNPSRVYAPTAIIGDREGVPARYGHDVQNDSVSPASLQTIPTDFDGELKGHEASTEDKDVTNAVQGTLAIDDSLMEKWKLWCGVIESLLRGEQPELSDAEYRQLQKGLLEQFQLHLARSEKGIKPLFQQMFDFVQPWLSLSSLPVSDRVALASLHIRCKRFSAALGASESKKWQWVIGFFLLGVAAFLAWLVIQEMPSIRTGAFPKPQILIREYPYVLLALMVPVFVAVVFFALRRTRRVT